MAGRGAVGLGAAGRGMGDQDGAAVPDLVPANSVSTFERLARDPEVSPEKLERLIALQERILDRQARSAFDVAFTELQAELPIVAELGRTDRTKYAKFEDIIRAVRPVLKKHGFSLSFETAWPGEGKIEIVGILTHCDGHARRSRFLSNADETGSKNKIQSLGSTISYGRRYTTLDLLGIATEDDDGQRSEAPPPPDGYDGWLLNLEAVADEGTPKLRAAWRASDEKFRLHLTKTDRPTWDGIQRRAAKADAAAKERS